MAASYYFAGSQRVALRVKGDPTPANNGVFYFVADHLGSTSVTLDANGAKIGEMKYYPFGETRYIDGALGTDRRFTGQREETGLGSLYDYNARMYSPVLGRFISADTIVPRPENPQTLNRFAYTLNNPVKFTDPSGHCIPGETCPEPKKPKNPPKPPKPPVAPPISDYWGGLSAAQLGAYSQDQGSANSCAEYASATAINMLTGSTLSGQSVSDLADLGFWAGSPGGSTRVLPGSATLPRQQEALVNWVDKIFADRGAPYDRFTATAGKSTPKGLIQQGSFGVSRRRQNCGKIAHPL